MKWLAVCGMVAPLVDVAVTAWLGSLDPDYSHVRQPISELGETGRPYAAVFSIWCVGWGLLFAGFAAGLARGLEGQKGAWFGPGALLVMAVSSVLGGFFPCDPGCAGRTFSGQAHILIGEIGTAGMVLAPFLTWVGMRRSQAWRGQRVFTLVSGGLLAVVIAWLAVCHYGDLGRSRCLAGAAQRLSFGILYAWVEVIAIRLWRLGTAGSADGWK